MLERALDFFVRLHSLEAVRIEVLPMTEYDEHTIEFGLTLPCTDSDGDLYQIYLDYSLPVMALLNVLSHELIHVQQFSSGRLDNDFHYWEWEGQPYAITSEHLAPWEIEANGLSGYYLTMYLQETNQSHLLEHRIEARFML